MTEERVPRRDFLKVTASTALTFGAGLPATAQTSASLIVYPSAACTVKGSGGTAFSLRFGG